MHQVVKMWSCLLVARHNAKRQKHQQHNADKERDDAAADQTAYEEADEADRGDQQCVRHLGRNVVNMVALCAGGCKDSRIRDRRDVVAADRAGQAGRNGHNQHGARRVAEYRDGNRDQDAEGAPGGAGRKGKAERDQEEDR